MVDCETKESPEKDWYRTARNEIISYTVIVIRGLNCYILNEITKTVNQYTSGIVMGLGVVTVGKAQCHDI